MGEGLIRGPDFPVVVEVVEETVTTSLLRDYSTNCRITILWLWS